MTQTGPERLAQLITLADKESDHLAGVRQRLFGDDGALGAEQIDALLQTDLGIDRLESFGAKFSRMQDTVVDKLIPQVLQQSGERVSAAIDNLSKMERLGLVASADDWLEMRGLRNRLVHEYIENPEHLELALESAYRFSKQMQQDYASIRRYAVDRLSIHLN